jgi:hypothetical protein
MNAVTADPATQDVTANESSTSTTYGALTTAGPVVTLTLVNGQRCLVTVSAHQATVSSGEGFMSFAVSGSTTQASSDVNATRTLITGVNYGVSVERTSVFVATATGSHTFTAQYRVANGANACSFINRRIIVKPF